MAMLVYQCFLQVSIGTDTLRQLFKTHLLQQCQNQLPQTGEGAGVHGGVVA